MVYNHFGHGVTSPWMTFLFAWPLLLGALPAAMIPVLRRKRRLSRTLHPIRNRPEDPEKPEQPDLTANSEMSEAPGRETEEKLSILRDLYPFGVAALTVGSLLYGILDIAGTGSDYPSFLLLAGSIMLVAGAWIRRKDL